MKKLGRILLLIAVSCAMCLPSFAQLTDQHLQAAQSELDALTQQVQTLTSSNSNLQSQVQSLSATVAQDGTTIADLNGQVSALEAQLAQAQNGVGFVSPLVTSYSNLQTRTDWVLASGTAGNTGATGSTGTCTFTPNADGTTTFAIAPNGQYYDCFLYRPLAGTWYSRKLPPAPAPKLGYFIYHVEYQGDVANLALSQALEMEARWYDGSFMYQMAGQIKMATHTLRYYNWCATSSSSGCVGGWIDTKIPVNIQPGQWEAIDLLYQAKAGITTFVGAYVDGAYHPLNIIIKAATKSVTPWMHTSIQLDSNKDGASYQVLVRNIGVEWF